MKVKIRTKDIRFSIPVPVSAIGFLIRLAPDSMFEEMRAKMPEPCHSLFTKDFITLLMKESIDILSYKQSFQKEGGL